MRKYRQLKGVLERLRVSQAACAEAAGMSGASLSQLIQHGRWPKRRDREEVKAAISAFLRQAGASEADLAAVFFTINKAAADAAQPTEETMFIRRQGLFPETRQHFGLAANPFLNDIQGRDDVYLDKDVRYVREALFQAARGREQFMALVGESGSGKTVLRWELLDRLAAENLPVKVIEPYVLGMEDNDKKGKTLKSSHISEAIMAVVAPLEKPLSSPEARFRQVDKALCASKRAGNAHCLIIEEAHCLPIVTLKHLKRYLELRDGLGSLLSIILIGQPELAQKLSESDYEVREVVQRCAVVTLRPMNGNLGEYLAFKFKRVGVEVDQVITEDGIEALRDRLTGSRGMSGGRGMVSFVYPLAVGNFMTAAMNVAAEIGAPVVDADVIKRV